MSINEEFETEFFNSKIAANSLEIQEAVQQITNKYTKDLDILIREVYDLLNSGQKINDNYVEDLLLKLPTFMYFTSESQEFVGIREDISKMVKIEVQNLARNSIKGTVADKTAHAEMCSFNESINQIMYQRCYKLIKNKIEMAMELLNSVKKINDRRLSETNISRKVII